jgi:hypothetical protein
MKILLTGHTSNIGTVLADHFQDHEVVLVSRATGFDLTQIEDINRVTELADNADCVINLANVGISQSLLLRNIYTRWQEKAHAGKIISIGSMATVASVDMLTKINAEFQMVANKLLLEKVHNELSTARPFGKQPQSTLLRFVNYGNRDRNGEPCTTAEQMIGMIDYVINSDTYVSTLDFREI